MLIIYYFSTIRKLHKLVIAPQVIEQPLDWSIQENKMMLAFYLAAPEVEKDLRSINTLSGMRKAKEEGRYTSKAPYGYRTCTLKN